MKRMCIFGCLSLIILLLGMMRFSNPRQKELKDSIALGKASETKTEINFTVGKITISSSSNQLCEGIYKYYKDQWKPDISYREENDVGYLKVISIDERENKEYDSADFSQWDIKLNKNIKNDLTIKYDGGLGNIDMHDCKLKRFEFSMAAGEIHINLRNTSVPEILFNAGTGKAIIDLSGIWNNDLEANIQGGVGEITLKLPENIGTKLNIHGMLGTVHARDFQKRNNIYTNDLFGKTKESLFINVTGGIGDVRIQLVD